MQTFDDIFAVFGGPARLAEAIGIKPFHAQTMKARRSIPPGYWPKVVDAAAQRGIEGVTYKQLAQIAASKHPLSPEHADEAVE